MKLKHKFIINIGDWSDDGHGKCDRVIIEANIKHEDVFKGYMNACKAYKVQLHEDDGGGICCHYQDDKISDETMKKLEELGCPLEFDEHLDGDGAAANSDDFANLWMWIASLSLPGLKWEITKNDLPMINYWGGESNHFYGYGLFDT